MVLALTKIIRQNLKQMTPPDDSPPESFATPLLESAADLQTSQGDVAKLSRIQRARNAAMKRHSRTNKVRNDIVQIDGSDVSEADNISSKTRSLQREKNQIAAATCRAKKRVDSEELQYRHREGATQNSYLLYQLMKLMDQKTFLRNTLLQHEPGLCQCHAIHFFNMAQAQQCASGIGEIALSPMSLSQDITTSS